MRHLGDYALSTVVYGKFTTFQPSTGASFLLGGSPALSVYKDAGTTESTTGVTITANFDNVTGLNHFAIDTSTDGTFYSTGSFFQVVITTGTVDSISVVGSVVGSFTINKEAALKPTTAGRTLDIATTGEAGLDFDNIKQASGATTLTNIRVPNVTLTDTVTTYTSNTPQTGDSFGRIGAAGAGLTSLGDTRIANLDATVSSRLAPAGTLAVVTLATTTTNLTNAPTNGDFTSAMKTSLNNATPAVTVSDKTGFSLTSAYDPAKTAAQAGDAMALTSGERTTLTTTIWANASRTLTSFGTLVADTTTAVWAAGTRTLTSFGTLVADVTTAVWAAGSRTLTAFGFTVTTDVSSTVTTNLDAKVSAAVSASVAVPASLLDSQDVESGLTVRQALRIIAAATAGKVSGAATTTVVIRNAVADSANRITATVDTDGNRTAITYVL